MNRNSKMGLGLVMAVIFGTLFLVWSGSRIYNSIDTGRKCTGRLKRAADASTIRLAKSELDAAIEYIEDNDLTEGSTAILYDTPDTDLGFWYSNIKDAAQELEDIPEEASRLERTNVLMKLRETLLDDSGQRGMKVTHPKGISVFPDNALYCWWGLVTGLWMCVGIILYVNGWTACY